MASMAAFPRRHPHRGGLLAAAVTTAAAAAAATLLVAGGTTPAAGAPTLVGGASAPTVVRADVDTPWNYTGATGPEFWHTLDERFAVCQAGERQSPINLEVEESVREDFTLFSLIRPGTADFTARAAIDNVPLECASEQCGQLQWRFNTYSLVNVHGHAPAEHTINGRTFPLEFHFVHTAGDKIAVLGVVFDYSSTPNPLLDRLLDAQDKAVGGDESASVGVTSTEWGTVERPEAGFCTWRGSLTTPPCTEDELIWFMELSVLPVSRAQVERFSRFRSVTTGLLNETANNRPLQPTNGREISCYGPQGELRATGGGGGGNGGGGGGAAAPPSDDDDDDAANAGGDAGSGDSDDETPADENAPTPVPTDEDPVCFPGDSTIRLADGTEMPLSEVPTGASVASGAANGAATTLFMWSHRLTTGTFPFVRLTTASGKTLTASAGHLIYASGARVPTGSVVVGDTLEAVPSDSCAPAVADRVVAVEAVTATGLYAPAVLEGVDVVVDGFRVSTLTTAVAPRLAMSLLAPLQWAYRRGWGSPTWLHGDAGWMAEGVRALVGVASRA